MLFLTLLTACSAGGTDEPLAASPAPGVSQPAGVPTRGATATPSPTARPTADTVLRIVLTNDDGVGSAGIDAMARALRALPKVSVTIVAPTVDRSGTGWATTAGGAGYSRARTTSGLRATAVAGYPADAVAVALDDLDVDPHLVVSGVNRGVNAGSSVPISGTVGAARAAIASGVPAVAASAAVPPRGGSPVYAPAVRSVTRWITAHRAELLAGTVTTATLLNVNSPYCVSGSVGAERSVAVADDIDVRPARLSNCRSSVRAPRTDVEALDNGFVAITRVPAVLSTPFPR